MVTVKKSSPNVSSCFFPILQKNFPDLIISTWTPRLDLIQQVTNAPVADVGICAYSPICLMNYEISHPIYRILMSELGGTF